MESFQGTAAEAVLERGPVRGLGGQATEDRRVGEGLTLREALSFRVRQSFLSCLAL